MTHDIPTEHVTINLDDLERQIATLAQRALDSADGEHLLGMATLLITELRVRQHRLDSLWRLIGRCDMAFELITEAKLLGPAKKTAKQLRAEIKKASNG